MNKESIRDYIINVLNGMAWGLFSSLLIGLIIKQIGTIFNIEALIFFGTVAQSLMGPAIGVGVAFAIKAPALVMISCAVAGAIGAGSITMVEGANTIAAGEPVGAFIAALLAGEIGKKVAGKTPVDIVLVPMVTIIVGGLVGLLVAPYVSALMNWLGEGINQATELHPIPMGIILSVSMGMILTLPISSAALAISLNLSGLAAGAATVGCCCNMIGFAVISYRDNGLGGSIAQGIGTSMLQIGNIIKKPLIWLPAIVSSAILGPIATSTGMVSNATGAGMGTSGLVGQFAMLEVMGTSPEVMIQMILMHFILPAVISYLVYLGMKKGHLIQDGDMTLART